MKCTSLLAGRAPERHRRDPHLHRVRPPHANGPAPNGLAARPKVTNRASSKLGPVSRKSDHRNCLDTIRNNVTKFTSVCDRVLGVAERRPTDDVTLVAIQVTAVGDSTAGVTQQ